eukprot:1161602-Pelagomonas_calceolata.AAC.9
MDEKECMSHHYAQDVRYMLTVAEPGLHPASKCNPRLKNLRSMLTQASLPVETQQCINACIQPVAAFLCKAVYTALTLQSRLECAHTLQSLSHTKPGSSLSWFAFAT